MYERALHQRDHRGRLERLGTVHPLGRPAGAARHPHGDHREPARRHELHRPERVRASTAASRSSSRRSTSTSALPAHAPDDAPNRVQDVLGAPVRHRRRSSIKRTLHVRAGQPAHRLRRATSTSSASSLERDRRGERVERGAEPRHRRHDPRRQRREHRVERRRAGGRQPTSASRRALGPGTYFVQVGHWDADGHRRLQRSACARDNVDTELHRPLVERARRKRIGMGPQHQPPGQHPLRDALHLRRERRADVAGDVGRREAGRRLLSRATLYRTTGPAFNARALVGADQAATVGTMRLAFSGSNAGTLTYTVQRHGGDQDHHAPGVLHAARRAPGLRSTAATPPTSRTSGGTRRSRAGA